MDRRQKIITALALLSIIGNIIVAIFYWIHPHENQTRYSLLSPTIRGNESTKELLINVTELRQALTEKIATYSADVGIYFDYIPTNTTIGINQREVFTLASLLKIPVAMATLEKVEEGDLTLEDTITITTEMLNKNYGPMWTVGAGAKITVNDALTKLLVDSDNTASEALLSRLTPEEIGRVFTSFDIPTMQEGGTLIITPKGYTSILRSLYYSTHLSPQNSQRILSLLTQSRTFDGSPPPIPTHIPYAHKIGVHDTTRTYSDCGIVYYPTHPFLYCVMIRNQNAAEAATAIHSLIQTMYEFIDRKATKS